MNKYDELELYVKQENFDIVGISETWLNDSIADSEVEIEGYTLLTKDKNSKTKKREGGVVLYIKNEINFVHREEFYSDKSP